MSRLLSCSVQSLVTPVQQCFRRQLSSLEALPSDFCIPQPSLSHKRMRALISLYHQTDTFITPENLSQRIDEAFVPSLKSKSVLPVMSSHQDHLTLQDLQQALVAQREAPKVTEPDREVKNTNTRGGNSEQDGTWSGERNVREGKVMETLYGVERVNGQLLPGLEILLEEQTKLEEDMKVDESNGGWLEEDMSTEI
ncbi:hypothetical protein AMATHDRAFT_2084 [Amanita thiersii Skay4041]|uniref:Uncharacterized protein n=1 Tax=Amanita thiersii Skay4041 TaxID=703135 RepID=A0A2A9NNY2_9AGAR|nr:hypothetical protein AMATHDRAFT_2084 [Amanita thiersii Skay4041]